MRNGREGEVRGEIAELRADNAELRADAAERETRLIRWVVGSMIGLAMAVAAIAGVAVAVLR